MRSPTLDEMYIAARLHCNWDQVPALLNPPVKECTR